MDNSIIVALIPAIASIIVMIISVRGSNKKTQETLRIQHDETLMELKNQNRIYELKLQSVDDKVSQLAEKVEKHNNFDRRLIAIETRLDLDDGK